MNFDVDNNLYFCLAGEVFKHNICSKKKGKVTLYKKKNMCNSCSIKDLCALSKQKSIISYSNEILSILKKYYMSSRTDEFKKSYRHRKAIVEPVFGNIKNKGMKIRVKGFKKVSTWFSIACIAHNLEKLIDKHNIDTFINIFASSNTFVFI